MATEGLNERHYFQLLHATLRTSGSDDEVDRTEQVMQWVAGARGTIDRVLEPMEMKLLGEVYKIWLSTKKTPTRETLETQVRNDRGLMQMLETYDQHEHALGFRTVDDMDLVLGDRKRDWEKRHFNAVLTQAQHINLSGAPNPDKKTAKTKPNLVGTKDASNYLLSKFQEGMLIDDVRAVGGALADYETQLAETYERNKRDAQDGSLTIPTGIPLIDVHMGGLRRKTMNGVLGYVGQRKSAVIRTIAYFAALNRFRVLHIPLESDFEEEHIAYNIFHAHTVDWGEIKKELPPDLRHLSKRNFEDGTLSESQEEFLMDTVRQHFSQEVGKYLIVRTPGESRTWADVKAIIERESFNEPIDMVVIDYLTMLSPDISSGDPKTAMVRMIQDAKRVALTANDGKGLCLITPVQGNRAGLEDAKVNDGAWQVSGIATYSEMDKSLDNCFYVYTDIELSADDTLKLGSCKMRRSLDIPSSLVSVNAMAGMLIPYRGSDLSQGNPRTSPQDSSKGKPAQAKERESYIEGFFEDLP